MAARKGALNLDLAERLGRLHCTDSEVAVALGVTVATVSRRADVQEAIAKGREYGKTSLRRAQWQKALGTREVIEIDADGKETVRQKAVEPNVAMLIWLGKQHLDQKEQAVVGVSELPVIEIVERIGPHAPKDAA